MMRTALTLLFIYTALMAMPLSAHAQKERILETEYFYRNVPRNYTIEQAEDEALNAAIMEKLAAEFGTFVARDSWHDMATENGETTISHSSTGHNIVKGELLGIIGKPKLKLEDVDGIKTIHVQVKFKARELKEARAMFEGAVCMNTPEGLTEKEEFRDGDAFCIRFRSPVNGYLAVYIEENGEVYRLTPIYGEEVCAIEAQKEYVFGLSDDYEYFLECEQQSAIDHIYYIFSPNRFPIGLDKFNYDRTKNREVGDFPMQDAKRFYKWLYDCRYKDAAMQVVNQNIIIKK